MAEGRDWAAVCIAPVIRRETSSPFQVVPVRKESPGRITASFELPQRSLNGKEPLALTPPSTFTKAFRVGVRKP